MVSTVSSENPRLRYSHVMETFLSPLDREKALSARVYAQLRQALMRGKFKPGTRLVQRTLAAEFDVSLTPVREAVLRLASEEALTLDQRGTAHVPQIEISIYAEILSLRLELEGRAAAAASGKPNARLAKELDAIHARMIAARLSGDVDTSLAENETFHFHIIKAAGMPVLEHLVENLGLRCGPLLRLLLPHERQRLDNHPHLDMIAAVRNGKPDAGRAAMTLDIQVGGDIILQMLAELSSWGNKEPDQKLGVRSRTG